MPKAVMLGVEVVEDATADVDRPVDRKVPEAVDTTLRIDAAITESNSTVLACFFKEIKQLTVQFEARPVFQFTHFRFCSVNGGFPNFRSETLSQGLSWPAGLSIECIEPGY